MEDQIQWDAQPDTSGLQSQIQWDSPGSGQNPQAEPSPAEQLYQQEDQLGTGIVKGVGDTVHGVGGLLRKGIDAIQSINPSHLAEKVGMLPHGSTDEFTNKIKETLVPASGHDALDKMTKPEGLWEHVGYGGENLAEFMLGDEALKGLSMADKFKNISQVMGIFEKSPRLMKALQMGTDISKAVGKLSAEEAAAIQKSPILARLVGHGMDAIRQGAAQGAQTLAKSGGDVKKAAQEGGTMAGVSGVLGGAGAVAGGALAKAGTAAKAVEDASAIAKAAPAKEEVGQTVKSAIDAAQDTMHSDFSEGIKGITQKIGDNSIPHTGSPLQKVAQDIQKLDSSPATKGVLQDAFKGAGGTEKSKQVVDTLANPETFGDLTVNELIERRQQLLERVRGIYKGANSPADRADADVYSKLIEGIDETIGQLADKSGRPEVAKDYQALRGAYKSKVNLFKEPVVKALQAGDLDSAAKTFLSGGKVLDKVNTLEGVLGKEGLQKFGKDVSDQIIAGASSETGQINPVQFVKDWKKIESLPDGVKKKLFNMQDAQDGLGKLAKDLKTASNYQRLVRAGILGGAGASLPLTHGWGLLLGLAGHGNFGKATELLDKVANSPRVWSMLKTAGSAKAGPVAKVVSSAIKKQATNALSNVYQGASEPLGEQ